MESSTENGFVEMTEFQARAARIADVAPPTYKAFTKSMPEAYAGLANVSQAADKAGLEAELIELIKVRASQINGCAFCLQFHLTLARNAGAPAAKLDLVATWREAGIYSPREKAALVWVERLTDLSCGAPPDTAWSDLLRVFSAAEATALTVAIASINAWNRIAVGLRFAPEVSA